MKLPLRGILKWLIIFFKMASSNEAAPTGHPGMADYFFNWLVPMKLPLRGGMDWQRRHLCPFVCKYG